MSTNTRVQLSIMMFLQFFIWGAWYVTMSNYLKGIGFGGIEVGNAYSTISLGAIFAPLFVGIISDRFFNAEKVLGVLHLIGAALLYWVSLTTNPNGFYWILLLYALCYMPTLAIVNSVAFNQMENPEKEFPSIRVMGTIAWIVVGLLVSFAELEASATTFRIASIVSVIMGIFSFFLPKTPPKGKGKKVSVGQLLGFDALKLMKNRSFAILIIGSLLVSIPLSFYYGFTNNFLNEAGMEKAAAKMSLGQVSEILFLLLMPLFFRKLGVKKLIMIGVFCWVARYLLFAYGNNDELVFMFYLGIILHGVCYDFFFVTGQIYVDNEAPEDVRSSAQGLIALVTYGLGMYIGSVYSGRVVESYEIMNDAGEIIGHNWWNIWMVPAALAGVVLILFAIFFREKKEASATA